MVAPRTDEHQKFYLSATPQTASAILVAEREEHVLPKKHAAALRPQPPDEAAASPGPRPKSSLPAEPATTPSAENPPQAGLARAPTNLPRKPALPHPRRPSSSIQYTSSALYYAMLASGTPCSKSSSSHSSSPPESCDTTSRGTPSRWSYPSPWNRSCAIPMPQTVSQDGTLSCNHSTCASTQLESSREEHWRISLLNGQIQRLKNLAKKKLSLPEIPCESIGPCEDVPIITEEVDELAFLFFS